MKRLSWLVPLLLLAVAVQAQAPGTMPNISIQVGNGQNGDLSQSLQVILLLTILSLAPAIIMLFTGFTRIVIVLGFVRSALGTQQLPPNNVLIGLALFLTAFIMAPTARQVQDRAITPYLQHRINFETAEALAMQPVRAFMFRQTRESDLGLFINLSRIPRPGVQSDVPTYVLVPAFVISEMKTAFTMGFLIFIPFVIIDLVVATVLMSMGMMMMPPVMISLPCKIILFVLINGWSLIAQSLVVSFH
jgi:flagellar biosynthetic protein FliP